MEKKERSSIFFTLISTYNLVILDSQGSLSQLPHLVMGWVGFLQKPIKAQAHGSLAE
jgi:hypothetical protein